MFSWPSLSFPGCSTTHSVPQKWIKLVISWFSLLWLIIICYTKSCLHVVFLTENATVGKREARRLGITFYDMVMSFLKFSIFKTTCFRKKLTKIPVTSQESTPIPCAMMLPGFLASFSIKSHESRTSSQPTLRLPPRQAGNSEAKRFGQ